MPCHGPSIFCAFSPPTPLFYCTHNRFLGFTQLLMSLQKEKRKNVFTDQNCLWGMRGMLIVRKLRKLGQTWVAGGLQRSSQFPTGENAPKTRDFVSALQGLAGRGEGLCFEGLFLPLLHSQSEDICRVDG
ncbi:hypothetical protein SUGI_0106730 [Cryptomeria japonica]|nr:hypothetical protein SUGI_0106730 [Cryptomeria japonica]